MQSNPVQVTPMWQASCDGCGWHTSPSTPMEAVREWARLHRVTCPLKKRPPALSAEEHTNRLTGVTNIDTLTDEQYEAIYHRRRPEDGGDDTDA